MKSKEVECNCGRRLTVQPHSHAHLCLDGEVPRIICPSCSEHENNVNFVKVLGIGVPDEDGIRPIIFYSADDEDWALRVKCKFCGSVSQKANIEVEVVQESENYSVFHVCERCNN